MSEALTKFNRNSDWIFIFYFNYVIHNQKKLLEKV